MEQLQFEIGGGSYYHDDATVNGKQERGRKRKQEGTGSTNHTASLLAYPVIN